MKFWSRRSPEPSPFEPQDRYFGLSAVEFNQLATYNGEKARGIVHTELWAYKMGILQRRYRDGSYLETRTEPYEF